LAYDLDSTLAAACVLVVEVADAAASVLDYVFELT